MDTQAAQMKEFLKELSQFAKEAEETLQFIEKDMEKNKSSFQIFSEMMFKIRGTCQQLGLPNIAEMAGLGEEIAVKGTQAAKRSQIRKCIGSLWDALTTIKYLIENDDKETAEEREILVHRLKYTLNAFGGERPKMSEDEIQALLNQRDE